ncbi:MAG: export ABC transporter ATP-binding protein, partial [Anaerosomatales bacterium]
LGSEGLAVLYTTHYMEEAERLCDRIGIIDHGRIVAEGTRRELVELVGQHDRVRLEATGDLARAAAALGELARVKGADAREDGLDLIVDGAPNALTELLAAVTASGATVTNVDVDEPDLESVFLHLTGRAFRD